jgi:protein required for attachment to host cells
MMINEGNMPTWILVANSAEAFLYGSDNLRNGNLTLVKEMTHPDSRKKISELVTDRAMRCSRAGRTGAGSDFTQRTDLKQVEAEHFAIELANELKHGFDVHKCVNIMVIAPAHFYGLLEKHLAGHVPEILHLDKDYTKYSIKKLEPIVHDLAFPEK